MTTNGWINLVISKCYELMWFTFISNPPEDQSRPAQCHQPQQWGHWGLPRPEACPPCLGSSDPASQLRVQPPGQSCHWWPWCPRPPGTWLTSTADHWQTWIHLCFNLLLSKCHPTCLQCQTVLCSSAFHSSWLQMHRCHYSGFWEAIPQRACQDLGIQWHVDPFQCCNKVLRYCLIN